MAGNTKNYSKDRGFEVIPRELLQNENLSLQAIGLLCNLQSYPENWDLYKTEVYKRFPKNKKTSVMNAWEELVEENYIAQLRRRNGKKWDYIYYFNLEPFTDEQIIEIEAKEKAKCTSFKQQTKSNVLDFGFSEAQNGKPKMGSPKSESNIDNYKDNTHKDNTNKNNTKNHHHEGFSKKQSDLINGFLHANGLKSDDDSIIQLVNRLKEYKTFNSVEYIGKTYKSIVEDKKTGKIESKSSEIVPDWFKEQKKAKEKKEQKKTPDQSDQEREELESLLKQYK